MNHAIGTNDLFCLCLISLNQFVHATVIIDDYDRRLPKNFLVCDFRGKRKCLNVKKHYIHLNIFFATA